MKPLFNLLIVCIFAVSFYSIRTRYDIPDKNNVIKLFGAATQYALPSSFKVSVWNIYKGIKPQWQEDFRSLIQDSHLVLVQEAYSSPAFDKFFTSFPGMQWDYATSFSYQRSNESTGVSIGSLVRPLNVHYLRSADLEPVVQTPKMALLSRYAIRNQTELLLVVNVHGMLAVGNETFRKQLAAIAAEIKHHSGPVIWGGDFNTWSGSRMKIATEITSELGLTPVAFSPDTRTKNFNRPIDLAFIRGLTLTSSKVRSEFNSSDHEPFEFTVQVPLLGLL